MAERQFERRLRRTAERFENVRVARDAAIREAAARGWSYRQIATVTGLSHQRVGQIVNAEP